MTNFTTTTMVVVLPARAIAYSGARIRRAMWGGSSLVSASEGIIAWANMYVRPVMTKDAANTHRCADKAESSTHWTDVSSAGCTHDTPLASGPSERRAYGS
jgi:hypothetical protein